VFTAAGGIDLELAPQVVTALDDVCVLSPRSFDTPSLTALLGEVSSVSDLVHNTQRTDRAILTHR